MNALQAVKRLNLLNNAEAPLERAIKSTKDYGDYEGAHSLQILLEELMCEKLDLECRMVDIEL